MKRLIFILAGGLFSIAATSQILELEDCRQKAVEYYPAFRQQELIAESSALETGNIRKAWLPDLNINGQASYQSDVTKVPIDVPQFSVDPVSKDWYKLYLDVTQVLYDGGATRHNVELASFNEKLDQQNLGIELYQVRQKVDQVYFSIILLRENKRLLEITEKEIRAMLGDVESGIRNGVILPIQADILGAELMKLEQRISEIEVAVSSLYSILSLMTGMPITSGDSLILPDPPVDLPADGSLRLEYGLFELQQQKLESMKRLSGARLIPKLMAFGQAGLGRPAFDMLNDDLDGFYIIGARLSWNMWNWNKTRNEKKIFGISQEIIRSKQDAFTRNLSIDLENRHADIRKYNALIEKDSEILALRENIVKTYASQLNNGVITATEYLSELNAETQARMNLWIHRVQLVQSKYAYLAAAGKL